MQRRQAAKADAKKAKADAMITKAEAKKAKADAMKTKAEAKKAKADVQMAKVPTKRKGKVESMVSTYGPDDQAHQMVTGLSALCPGRAPVARMR